MDAVGGIKRRAGKSMGTGMDKKFKSGGKFSAQNPYGRRDGDRRQFQH